MNTRKLLLLLASSLSLMLSVATTAAADSIRDFGRHIVHCKFVASDELEADVATQLQINPTPGRGALIIAIMEKPDDGSMEHPIRGEVAAHWSDLKGMMGTIHVREIRDQAAIYYVGEFDIPKTRMMTFDILVGVEENKPPYSLNFSKSFSAS